MSDRERTLGDKMRVAAVGWSFLVLLSGLTPEASPTPLDAGQETVRRAVAATDALETFRFLIHNERGETELFAGVTIEEIEGAVRRPDRFRADVRGSAFFAPVEISVIAVGDRFWWSNPLTGGDDFEETTIEPEILLLVNPDTLVRLIPPLVTDPRLVGRESVDGESLTLLGGSLDLSRLAEVAPELPTGGVNTDEPLPIEVWIDDADRIRRIRITGPFVDQDSDDIVRVVEFFAFDEPVEIEPPG